MQPQLLLATGANNRASMLQRRRRRRRSAASAVFLLVFCLHLMITGEVRGDIHDCKSKVLNAWVMHCATDGARGKRSAILAGGPNAEGNPSARFKQPVSGDDLSVGLLSPVDIDQLVTDLYGRYQRATQSKEQFIKMINTLAAKCCNENLHNSCMIDAANLITCP